VRCTGVDSDGDPCCKVMRRIPLHRPTSGPDDPRAIPPKRGRPFKQGNVYRMQPGEQPGRRLPVQSASTSSATQRTQGPAASSKTSPTALLDPYRPCGLCSEENNLTGPGGTWPGAVDELELWSVDNDFRRLFVCASHYRDVMRQAPGEQVRVYSKRKRIA
jgi:hypothetical protein